MRVWGRIYDKLNPDIWTWQIVETDVNGFDDLPMVTALVQVLKLSLGESPFYGDYGIPGHQSVITQIYPDYYVALTQQRYAPAFASLIINRRPSEVKTLKDEPRAVYDVRLVTHQGVHLTTSTQYPT
jgi:hypothetical protein